MPRDKTPPSQLRRKEADQMEALIRLYYPDILHYVIWRLRDSHQAEDVTQETFIKVARYLGAPFSQGKFRALLYKIAANLCIDASRKRQTEPLADNMVNAEDGFAEVEARDGFAYMLEFLPVEQQELILLRYGHDLKIREVADTLGLPLRTAQSRLRAALKTLKIYLEKEEKTDEQEPALYAGNRTV